MGNPKKFSTLIYFKPFSGNPRLTKAMSEFRDASLRREEGFYFSSVFEILGMIQLPKN